MFPCVTTLLENRKRTDSWVAQRLWPTKHNHKTFPDSEWGKCRLVSLGTKGAILKLKFTFDPGQAGCLVRRPNLSKTGIGLLRELFWPLTTTRPPTQHGPVSAHSIGGTHENMWALRLYCVYVWPKPPGFWSQTPILKQWKTWHLKYTQTAHMQLMSPRRQKTHTSVGNALIRFQASLYPSEIHSTAASVPLRADWTGII